MNPFNLMSMYQSFMQNPMQMLSQRFNIPQDMNNPNDILQHLLDTNQVNQNQVNMIRNNPMLQQFIRAS